MKKYFVSVILLLLLALLFTSCLFDDEEEGWSASKVCPEAGTNRYGMPNRGTFTDERDGRVYKYTTIGEQVWMAENLKYNAPYSMCPVGEAYAESFCFLANEECYTLECCTQNLCELFGRYYSVIENGDGEGVIDRILADTICPNGWHIPIKKELDLLFDNMMGNDDEWIGADRMISSDSNMLYNKEGYSLGTDDCGLSFYVSGSYGKKNDFYLNSGTILSSTQVDGGHVWVGTVGNKINWLQNVYRSSVRCIKD